MSTPLPNIDDDIREFWNGIEQGKFMLTRCGVCGAWYWPISYCRNPHRAAPFMADMSWTEASGRGKVFAFNIHYVPLESWLKDRVPYVNALIETDEGPMFGTNVVDIKPEKVTIGMPVEIVVREVGGVKLPMAVPASTAGTA